MFADTPLAARIDIAEARLTHALISGVCQADPNAAPFLRDVGHGVAAFARPGSPVNRVIGLGLDAPLDEAALAEVEDAFRVRKAPLRVELSTLAPPQVGRRLTERGYQLSGFDIVLGRALDAEPNALERTPSPIRVERATRMQDGEWLRTAVEGFAYEDDSGVPGDVFTHDAISAAMQDFAHAPGFERYLAWREGSIVGAASMRVDDQIVFFTGATTLPEHRRRGVQSELLKQRLADARAQGAKLAIVATSPGTQSQANIMRQGFSVLYARARLVLEFSTGTAASRHSVRG